MAKAEHHLTCRAPDFTALDEIYHLEGVDPARVTVLAYTHWQGKQQPMVLARQFGAGRVSYLAHGHSLQAWNHPEFRKLVLRAVAWSAGAEIPQK